MADTATIPEFAIESELGTGGTGTVYRAREVATDRTVALKIIPLDEDPTRRKRFALEAKVGAMLEHPDIIETYETGSVEGLGWISMELLDGKELAAVKNDPTFTLDDRLDVVNRVAHALHYAHGQELVHRDVKPSNVFLTSDGGLRLLDFGIARLKANKITKTGFIVGTPQFMAPEQISALPVDARADIFSLGVVLYELLSGRLPWNGDNHTQVMIAVCSKPPEPLGETFDRTRFNLDESRIEALGRIVHRAIEQDPKKRHDSALDFGVELKRFVAGNEPAPAPDAAPPLNDDATARAALLGASTRPAIDTTTRELPSDDTGASRFDPLWLTLMIVTAVGLVVVAIVLMGT